MRTRWFVLLTLLVVAPARGAAVSVQDVIELTRAGLGDEVIVALVETSGAVYTLSPQQVLELKHAGVSERVIVLMLRQGRTNPPVPPPAAPDPAASAASPPALPYGAAWQAGGVPPGEAPSTTVVVVTPGFGYPVFVPWRPFHPPRAHGVRHADRSGGFGRFINDGFRTGTPIAVWGPVSADSRRGPKSD